MTCTGCGSDRLALVLEPGEREPTCAVCLGCGALQDTATFAPGGQRNVEQA